MINSFTGKYRWLSNFWMVPVQFEGIFYPSVENAYQAAKTTNITLRKAFIGITPGQAKHKSKEIVLRKNWDKIKIPIMQNLVFEKFNTPYLQSLLLNTGSEELIEGNNWGDTFWGVCNGIGENHLGIILMYVRSVLSDNMSFLR